MPSVTVRTMTAEDADWADRLLSGYQATRMTARLGELLDPLELPGLVAEVGGSPVGLLTYQVEGDQMEALTMHAQASGHGAGSALLAAAVVEARHAKARRLWLVTTNDNLSAIRFYLRRGMHVARVHEGAVDRDRQLKPEMARVNGENGSRGSKQYDKDHASEFPNHFAVNETDGGAGHPVGLNLKAQPEVKKIFEPVAKILETIGAGTLSLAEHVGADTDPIEKAGVPAFSPMQDNRSYFNYHHTAADTLDKIVPRELQENAGVVAVAAYAFANAEQSLPRESEE